MVNILSCFFSFLDAVTFVKDLLEICLKIFLVHKWSLMRTWILIRLITNADPNHLWHAKNFSPGGGVKSAVACAGPQGSPFIVRNYVIYLNPFHFIIE